MVTSTRELLSPTYPHHWWWFWSNQGRSAWRGRRSCRCPRRPRANKLSRKASVVRWSLCRKDRRGCQRDTFRSNPHRHYRSRLHRTCSTPMGRTHRCLKGEFSCELVCSATYSTQPTWSRPTVRVTPDTTGHTVAVGGIRNLFVRGGTTERNFGVRRVKSRWQHVGADANHREMEESRQSVAA